MELASAKPRRKGCLSNGFAKPRGLHRTRTPRAYAEPKLPVTNLNRIARRPPWMAKVDDFVQLRPQRNVLTSTQKPIHRNDILIKRSRPRRTQQSRNARPAPPRNRGKSKRTSETKIRQFYQSLRPRRSTYRSKVFLSRATLRPKSAATRFPIALFSSRPRSGTPDMN
jgi:hypothetical protein